MLLDVFHAGAPEEYSAPRVIFRKYISAPISENLGNLSSIYHCYRDESLASEQNSGKPSLQEQLTIIHLATEL